MSLVKATVYIATSLDGFIAREDGALDWLPDPAASEGSNGDFGYRAFMDTVDVLVMGRNTYETVLGFGGEWPYGDKRVVVLSRTLTQLAAGVPDTVELKSGSPAKVVAELAESGAQHLYIDGGTVIQDFLRAGLIQELIITRIPVLIGSGIPLFGPLEKDVRLQHIETHVFTSGLVQSKYRVR